MNERAREARAPTIAIVLSIVAAQSCKRFEKALRRSSQRRRPAIAPGPNGAADHRRNASPSSATLRHDVDRRSDPAVLPVVRRHGGAGEPIPEPFANTTRRRAAVFAGASRQARAFAAASAAAAAAGHAAAGERRAACRGAAAGNAGARHLGSAAIPSPRAARANARLRDTMAQDHAGGARGRDDLAGIRDEMSGPLIADAGEVRERA